MSMAIRQEPTRVEPQELKYLTFVEATDSDKHSNLEGYMIIYGRKGF